MTMRPGAMRLVAGPTARSFAEPRNWSLTGVSPRDAEEGRMRGILALLVIVYLVGIGVVLASRRGQGQFGCYVQVDRLQSGQEEWQEPSQACRHADAINRS
jgi:hypothetical protein